MKNTPPGVNSRLENRRRKKSVNWKTDRNYPK